MAKNLHYYDTSAYPKTHPVYSPINVKVTGKFKDETNSVLPQEFVSLRAKMYSLYVPNIENESKMTAKGIKKAILSIT